MVWTEWVPIVAVIIAGLSLLLHWKRHGRSAHVEDHTLVSTKLAECQRECEQIEKDNERLRRDNEELREHNYRLMQRITQLDGGSDSRRKT